MNDLLQTLAAAVAAGKIDANSPYPPEMSGRPGADELTAQALADGITPAEVLSLGLVAGMKAVGDRFRDGEVYLPEVLMAARALNAGFEHLKPYFRSGAIRHKGTIVMGTVAGDLHDIGKRIVALFFEGGGWNVVDLGVDVSLEKFITAIEANKPMAVGLSTLLTTTMASMETIARGIRARFPDIKIVIGGAPITPAFATRIDADASFPDPQGALDFLNQ